MRLDDLLRRHAAARRHEPAFTCGDVTVTWSESDERANRLANALRSRDLRPGDRVALLATNCHRYWEFHFACSKAGLIGVPLNPRLIGPELHYILSDAGAAAIVSDAGHAEVVTKVAVDLPHLGTLVGYGEGHELPLDYETELAAAASEDPGIPVRGDDVNVIGYTSGTTGRPKGAMLTHHFATISAVVYAMTSGLQPDDRALATMPAYVYRGGSGGFAPIAAGAHTVVAAFEPRRILDLWERHRITYAILAPAMVNMLLRQPDLPDRDLSSTRSLWTGGAPIREETLKQLIEVFGDVVGAVYGMTEATGIAQIRHRTGAGQQRLLSVGRPMPLLDVRIVTEDGKDAEPDEVGEITVRGDTVMAGYWNDPARTAEVLRSGWFATGDVGYLDGEGYLFIVDRRKDIINSGGINVYSVELENVINLLPGVVECAVIGVPDDDWGEIVAAFVVTDPAHALDTDDVIEHCRQHLAGYKKPRVVDFVAELPRNEMGKIDKKALREPYWAGLGRGVHG